jgi:hypothetical protein
MILKNYSILCHFNPTKFHQKLIKAIKSNITLIKKKSLKLPQFILRSYQ